MSIARPLVHFAIASALAFGLSSCDIDLFGLDTKKLAAGYRLTVWEGGLYALLRPQEDSGSTVIDIGWKKPFIVSRSDEGEPWQVIDTSTNQTLSLSEEQRRTDPKYRDVPIYRADVAWDRLRYGRRQW
jgi:hypothetical protein